MILPQQLLFASTGRRGGGSKKANSGSFISVLIADWVIRELSVASACSIANIRIGPSADAKVAAVASAVSAEKKSGPGISSGR
jgi:hypothetical protein